MTVPLSLVFNFLGLYFEESASIAVILPQGMYLCEACPNLLLNLNPLDRKLSVHRI
jgi:hypothetical protein